MKKFIAIALTLASLAITATAQTAPKTVRDYFMALPERYFSLDCCYSIKPYRKAKEEYLKRYLVLDDPSNGFIKASGDAAQEGFEMALFKRSDSSYLVGFYTEGEGGVEDTPWTVFLNYRAGKWSDVSRQIIKGYSKERYIYQLPRRGTTIAVYAKDENGEGFYRGKKLYDLEWKNGSFTRSRR